MKGIIKSIFGPTSSIGSSNGWFLNAFGNRSQAGTTVNDFSALSLAPFFECNRAISEDIAKIPKQVITRLPNNGRSIDETHVSFNTLTLQPNPIMTAITFYETLMGHVLTHGNGYAEIEFFKNDRKRAKHLWPLPPNRVNPTKVKKSNGEVDVVYRVTFDDGSQRDLPKENIIHIKGLGYDGLIGYSIIQYATNAIGLGTALEEFGSKFFSNGSQSGGYVTIPEGMQESEIENLKTHYEQLNDGLDNAHRFKFLYDSVEFTPTSIKPEEAQFLLTRVNQVKEIARFYRMPLHKLQESGDISYSTAEQLNIDYVNDTLMAWIVKWEQELKIKLFTDKRDANLFVNFNVNGLLRGDSIARANFYRTMIFSGAMNPNEARLEEERPPYEGGDAFMKPANMNLISDKEADANERVQD